MNHNTMTILDETINRNMEINEAAFTKLVHTSCDGKNLDNYIRNIYFTNQEMVCPEAICCHTIKK